MNCFKYDTRHCFLLGMRIYFGLWLVYMGFAKWVLMGSAAFVGYITTQFDPTWSPHVLNVGLAWVILVAEPLLGLLLLLGKCQRCVWTLTSVLMFLLMMGITILMKPTVNANWQFLVLTLVCAALCEPESKAPPAAAV